MRISIKKIIFATDLSEQSNRVAAYAFFLTKELKAKLYMCHIVDLPPVAVYYESIPDPVEQQERALAYTRQNLKRIVGEEQIDWEPLISVGNTADEIVRMANETGADLVISATQGHVGLKRFVLGSVAARLMHMLPCPLLVVRNPEAQIKIKSILVGCDFSPDSNLAIQYGLMLAQEFQAEIHLVHVIKPLLYKDLLKVTNEPMKEIQEDLPKVLHEKLANLIPEEAHNWCKIETTLLAGQPHEELTKYSVVNDIDMIVLGVRGHGMVETLFVGSTTDRVIRQVACPVLAVRPAGKTSLSKGQEK